MHIHPDNETFEKCNIVFRRELTEHTLNFIDIYNIQNKEFIYKKIKQMEYIIKIRY